MAEYHFPTSCNKCKGENRVNWVSEVSGHLCECETKCKDCDFEDYWAYGFFQSSCDMVSNCETYS